MHVPAVMAQGGVRWLHEARRHEGEGIFMLKGARLVAAQLSHLQLGRRAHDDSVLPDQR